MPSGKRSEPPTPSLAISSMSRPRASISSVALIVNGAGEAAVVAEPDGSSWVDGEGEAAVRAVFAVMGALRAKGFLGAGTGARGDAGALEIRPDRHQLNFRLW